MPILILITTLAGEIPAEYREFFAGVQKMLVNPQYLESEDKDLVMLFLLRSKFQGELPASVLESAKLDNRYYVKALSTCLLLSSSRGYN